MRLSLPGLAKTASRALKSSRDDLACMAAFSVSELVDNLRVLKEGGCTIDEFFEVYVFDSKSDGKLADRIKAEDYYCMRDEPAEEDA